MLLVKKIILKALQILSHLKYYDSKHKSSDLLFGTSTIQIANKPKSQQVKSQFDKWKHDSTYNFLTQIHTNLKVTED